LPQPRRHRHAESGGVRKRGERGIEAGPRILHHAVQYVTRRLGLDITHAIGTVLPLPRTLAVSRYGRVLAAVVGSLVSNEYSISASGTSALAAGAALRAGSALIAVGACLASPRRYPPKATTSARTNAATPLKTRATVEVTLSWAESVTAPL